MGFSDIALSAFSTAGLDLDRLGNHAENGSPVVKVADIHIVQRLLLEEVLSHKQLGYGIADRRTCGYTLSTQRTPIQSQSIKPVSIRI